jgi:signal transduction histidine kinase
MLPLGGWMPSSNVLFWGFFMFGTALSGSIGYMLARRLVRPVKLLNKGVQRIAAGDLGCQVEVEGADEIAGLGAGFNLMSKQLEIMRHENIQSARRERSRMLGEIALGFAHEIRNPLVVIKTSAELVQTRLPHEAKESRLLGFVVEEVGRIDRLISEFLAFAKPGPLKFEYFDLDLLLRDVVEISAAEFSRRGITCSITNETLDGKVLGEQNQIRQVLLNLILNAMDAMPEGGSLSLRLYETEAASRVCLEVADTGAGIAEELLRTMHLPFVSTKKNGLGLGLPKAYAIIEEHGGSIACASSLGEGTTFTIGLNR